LSYSFDRIVLIFGYIVQHTNTKILSRHFCNFHLEPKLWRHKWCNFRFCKVVVQRCGFHHWI